VQEATIQYARIIEFISGIYAETLQIFMTKADMEIKVTGVI
jgi:hypothetical protein